MKETTGLELLVALATHFLLDLGFTVNSGTKFSKCAFRDGIERDASVIFLIIPMPGGGEYLRNTIEGWCTPLGAHL